MNYEQLKELLALDKKELNLNASSEIFKSVRCEVVAAIASIAGIILLWMLMVIFFWHIIPSTYLESDFKIGIFVGVTLVVLGGILAIRLLIKNFLNYKHKERKLQLKKYKEELKYYMDWRALHLNSELTQG